METFRVVHKETEFQSKNQLTKRLTYVISGNSIDIGELSGDFELLPDKYRVALTDVPNKFIKNEVVNTEYYNTDQMTKEYDLIQKVGTEELYWVYSEDDFIAKLIREQSDKEIIAMIRKLGLKEYRDEYGQLRTKSKTSEIKLNDRTYAELKKDPSYITKIDTDQQKISALVKQTLPHSKTLDKYLSTYNIKRSKMASTDLNAWRTATNNAQKLHSQIYAISKKYDGNTSFTLLDKSNALDNFLDNLNASKGVLGM